MKGSWKKIIIPLVAIAALAVGMASWQIPQVKAAIENSVLTNPAEPVPALSQDNRPYIGILLVNNNARIQERLGLNTDQGVVITRVIQNSPGAAAGLAEKDIINAVDGTAVNNAADVTSAVKAKNVGDSITLSISRNGSSQEITVTLGAAPQPQARPDREKSHSGPLGGLLGNAPLENLRSPTVTVTDKDGNERTINIVAGTVSSASATSISVTPNGESTAQTFTVDGNTRAGWIDRIENLKQGERVLVIAEDGKALQIVSRNINLHSKLQDLGRGMLNMPFRFFGPDRSVKPDGKAQPDRNSQQRPASLNGFSF